MIPLIQSKYSYYLLRKDLRLCYNDRNIRQMNHAALFDPEAKIQVLLTRPQLSAETTLLVNVRLLYLLTYLKKKSSSSPCERFVS